jgi:hypothetical protein
MKVKKILTKDQVEMIENKIRHLIKNGPDNSPETVQMIDRLHDLYTTSIHSKQERGSGWKVYTNENK